MKHLKIIIQDIARNREELSEVTLKKIRFMFLDLLKEMKYGG